MHAYIKINMKEIVRKKNPSRTWKSLLVKFFIIRIEHMKIVQHSFACNETWTWYKGSSMYIYNLENSTRVDFVEDIAENEAIAKCKAEVFFGGFFGQCWWCAMVHLT